MPDLDDELQELMVVFGSKEEFPRREVLKEATQPGRTAHADALDVGTYYSGGQDVSNEAMSHKDL